MPNCGTYANHWKKVPEGIIVIKTIHTDHIVPKRRAYPWHELKVGEGFFILDDFRTSMQIHALKSRVCSSHFKKHGVRIRFSQRKTPEGVLIWRTK